MKITTGIFIIFIFNSFNLSYSESIFNINKDKKCWCEDGTTIKKDNFFNYKEKNEDIKGKEIYRDNELEVIICDYDSRGRLKCKDAKEY